MDSLHGLTEEATRDSGKMENKMEKECTEIKMEMKEMGHG